MITVARSAILFAPALPPASVALPGLGCVVPIFHECDVLPKRGVFDKSPNRPASPARRLVIEATYPL